MKFEAMRYTMSKLPRPARRKLLHSRPAQYEMTACYAGKTDLVHEKIIAKGMEQYRFRSAARPTFSSLAFLIFHRTTSTRF